MAESGTSETPPRPSQPPPPRQRRSVSTSTRALLVIIAALGSWEGLRGLKIHIPDDYYASSFNDIYASTINKTLANVLTAEELASAESIYIINRTSGTYTLNQSTTESDAKLGPLHHQPAISEPPRITAAAVPPPNFTIARQPFDSFFVNTSKHQQLHIDADKDGPILDFAIIGHAKCGTTTMSANLGKLAPMPVADICTPPVKTVWYAYNNWPKQFGKDKIMRAYKCPSVIDTFGEGGPPSLADLSKHLPRTKLIIGIRHPVLWFQSFYNMLGTRSKLPPPDDPFYIKGGRAKGYCSPGALVCLNRARMHFSLASLGKTPLDDTERQYLPQELGTPTPIRNSIFLYDTEQLGDDNVTRREKLWSDVADFIGYPGIIPHDEYRGSHGRKGKPKTPKLDVCEAQWDALRGKILVYGYQMSKWIYDYFVVRGKDVHVTSPEYLRELIQSYARDHCGRIERVSQRVYRVIESNATLYV